MAERPKVPWAGRPVWRKQGDVVILEPEQAPAAVDRADLVRALALVLLRSAVTTSPAPEQGTESQA